MTMQPDELLGWTPTKISGGQVTWRRFGALRIADPFFEDTVQRALGDPELGALSQRTSLERLAEVAAACPGLPPSGFIFHLSRCGSTLVSQQLAALRWTICVAEAQPIDAVLRSSEPLEVRVERLRALVSVLGQRRLGTERALIVKLDAWHMPELPVIQRAFPGVPWIFVYRDPVEILVSHARQRGSHMVPGVIEPNGLGLDPGLLPGESLDEYGAHVLAAIGQSALEGQARGGGRLVNYRELPALVETELAARFGLELDEADREAMRSARQVSAKRPEQRFVADSAGKQGEASDALRRLSEEIVGDVHARLEAARTASPPPSPRPRRVRARGAPPVAPALLPVSLKLPFTADAEQLRAEVAALDPAAFVPHFNNGYYQGDWSAVSLRSIDGREGQIYADPTRRDAHTDTPLLAKCPTARAFLEALGCPVRAVRFMRLGARSAIREHRDFDLGIELGEVRLHVPVTTSDEVDFIVGGARAVMRAGECWYHDFGLPHEVRNRGDSARVHLVIDCVLNEALRAALDAAAEVRSGAPTA